MARVREWEEESVELNLIMHIIDNQDIVKNEYTGIIMDTYIIMH